AYEDRMMLYTFSCIKQDTMLDDVESNERLLDRNTLVNFDNTFHAQPSKSEEEELTRWSRKRWQGFSKEGGCLVAFDTNRFHLDFLGQYHSSYYLDIFILAVLQRITLLSLFERMADIQALTRGDRKSRRAFRRVHKDLLLFKNKIWFSQITNRERGLALWRMWQSTFENRTLLEEVNEQSKELNAYIRTQTREKIEWMVRIAGFLGATVPALLTAKTFFNKYSWGPTLRWSLLSAILLGTGIFAWRVLVKGDDE
ncbi:MAG TPA: hypothetical protein DCE42_09435, partial [Myxococcales bacterium]|nr:hypothetical protein [Myxococcales bacterium]